MCGTRVRGLTGSMNAELELSLRAHAEAAYPEECVGALLADGGRLVAAVPLENCATDRRRAFAVHPRDYLAAERSAAARGLTLTGLYHSHPDAPAVPSTSDRETAAPGLFTVIVPVVAGRAGAPRTFHFDDAADDFVEGAAP